MPDYYLGIDVGGTKSHALIADGSGQVLGVGRAGTGNPESIGWEGLEAVLHAITTEALAAAGLGRAQLTGAGFGIAGYDWPSDHPPTCHAIDTLGLPCPWTLVNDTLLGLVAGAEAGWGVALVAGTGNNCRGRDAAGREGRVVGSGLLLGEGGGAGEIVIAAVQAVSRAWSLRGPRTRLTETLVARAGVESAAQLLEGLMREQFALGAETARLVFAVAEEGDPVAREIIAEAGRELGSLAVGVIRQLELQSLAFDVVLMGSVFNGGPLLIEPLGETIEAEAPQARLVRLNAPPVVGAVLLGMEAVSRAYAGVRSRLSATTEALLC